MFRPSSRSPSLPRRRPRPFAVAIAAGACCLSAAGQQEGQPPPPSVYSRQARATLKAVRAAAAQPAVGPVAATPGESDAAAQAERIVASGIAAIGRAESVSIKLRQRVRIGERVLVGAGRYLQAGQGEEQRFRFEVSLTSDSAAHGIERESFEVTEVSDGIFCWLHQRNGPDPPILQRLDVQRVRGRLAELGAADPADAAPYLGGLRRMLWWVRHWFRFTTAVPGEADGRAVWLVEGRWPPGTLGAILPSLAESERREGGVRAEELPDGMPWVVRLAIGRADLLPVRIEFLAIPGERPVSAGPLEVIMALEFLEVELDAPVDASAFYYQPASEELIDLTEIVLRTMALPRP